MKQSNKNTISLLSACGEGLRVRFFILVTLFTIHSSLFIKAQSPEWIIYDKNTVTEIKINQDSYTNFVAVDDSNNIWTEFSPSGIAKFDGENWTAFYYYYDSTSWWLAGNLGDIVFNFQNSIWISADGNLTKLSPGIDTMHINIMGFDSLRWNPSTRVQVMGLETDGVYLWIGTDTGLVRYDGTNWSLYNKVNGKMPSNMIVGILIDVNDYYWLTTDSGLVKWNGDTTWEIWNTTNSLMPYNNFWDYAFDKDDNLWMSFYKLFESDQSIQIAKFDGSNWTIYDTTNSGLPKTPSNFATSFAFDEYNNKWIGTGLGLVKYNDTIWTIYDTTNSEIPDNVVYDLAIDSLGNIWMATFHGLACFNETGIVTGIIKKEDGKEIQSVSTFYPNPHEKNVKVRYKVVQPSQVQCDIYDSAGNFIGRFLNKEQSPGSYDDNINTADLTSGAYMFKLKIGNRLETKKIIIK